MANSSHRGDGIIIFHAAGKCNVARHASPIDTKSLDGQHADLLEILFRLASSAGARVKFGVTVESVEPAPETPPETFKIRTPIAGPASRTLRPAVRLRTGEILHADVIIGADGRRSLVRSVVTGVYEPETPPIGISHYTGSVPMTEIRKYAPLKQLLDIGWPIWFGHKRIVAGTSRSFILAMVLPLLIGPSGSLAYPVVSLDAVREWT